MSLADPKATERKEIPRFSGQCMHVCACPRTRLEQNQRITQKSRNQATEWEKQRNPQDRQRPMWTPN